MLDASVSGDDVILEVIRLDAELCEVAEEVLVDHLELAAEHSPGVDVAGIRLHTLVNLGLERGPVVEVGGGHTPHVVLEDPLGHAPSLSAISHEASKAP